MDSYCFVLISQDLYGSILDLLGPPWTSLDILGPHWASLYILGPHSSFCPLVERRAAQSDPHKQKKVTHESDPRWVTFAPVPRKSVSMLGLLVSPCASLYLLGPQTEFLTDCNARSTELTQAPESPSQIAAKSHQNQSQSPNKTKPTPSLPSFQPNSETNLRAPLNRPSQC